MVEIYNSTKILVNKSHLRKVAEFILEREGKKGEHVSIALIGEAEMKRINKAYRGKEYAANVLSFSGVDGLGEVLLCPRVISKDAKEYGILPELELVSMLAHGVLHLLGYDHEQGEVGASIMKEKENHYLSFFA